MSARELLSLHDLAGHCGCQLRVVERFFRLGVIEEAERRQHQPLFGRRAVDRMSRALRLRRDLRIGTSSLGLVLDLLERIEQLEAELARQRKRSS
jgi:hypothetical protein